MVTLLKFCNTLLKHLFFFVSNIFQFVNITMMFALQLNVQPLFQTLLLRSHFSNSDTMMLDWGRGGPALFQLGKGRLSPHITIVLYDFFLV